MNEVLGYLVSFLGGGGLVAAALFWALSNLEKVEAFMAWFHRTFSWAYRKWEYGNVATNIQASVNTARQALNAEGGEVLPHAMKIEWAKTAEVTEAFLKSGEIVVTMDYSPNRDRNLVVSTLLYLGKGLLPRARPYVDDTLMTATDFTVAKSIFMSARESLAMSFFFEKYLQPEMEKEPHLRDDCTLLDGLRQSGFFSRIFLRQIQYVGENAFPAIPDDATKRESRDFAQFLSKIATKERGEDVPGGLTFARSRIRASVMLIARQDTKLWGTGAYDRRTRIHLDRGVEYMYICARGADNISLAQQVASEQESAGRVRVLARHSFVEAIENMELPVTCIACALNLLSPAGRAPEPSSVLYRLLEEHIEELRDGRIEVVATARQRGIRSKVAVRSLTSGVDVLACCTEKTRLGAIQAALGGEQVEFIRWSNDPQSLILASLTPLDPTKVVDVNIDLEKRAVTVQVDGWKARRKALGRGDQNTRCAAELTGWQITVEEAPEEEVAGQEQ
ncbi:MAG: hypothetical protein WBB22_15245 [Anaerolineae bacterium]